MLHGSSSNRAIRNDINIQLNERRVRRNINISTQGALSNPNSNKRPSDDVLRQDFGPMMIGGGDSEESSYYTSPRSETNQPVGHNDLIIERVYDEIKVEQKEAKEDIMKCKMREQFSLCTETFNEEYGSQMDKEVLNNENEWLIVEHKKLWNEYNDLKGIYKKVVAENEDWMQKYESLKNWAKVNFGAESYCDKIYQNLHDAADIGSMKACRALINWKVDVNRADKNGYIPLFFAAKSANVKVCAYLLTHKSKINVRGKNGQTPLDLAVRTGNTALCDVLLDHKANMEIPDSGDKTPFFKILELGQKHMVEYFISKGMNVNATSQVGLTPLHEAAYFGRVQACESLLNHSAHLNTRISSGISPLSIVVSSGNLVLCKLFLSKKADVNQTLKSGESLFHLAASKGSVNICKCLVEAEADPFAPKNVNENRLCNAKLFLTTSQATSEVVEYVYSLVYKMD